MRQADFFKLPRATQERFIAATRSEGVPRPIAVSPHESRAPLLWGALSAVWLIALAGYAALGFGELKSSFALAPASRIAIYVLLFGLCFVCLLRAAALRERMARWPYRMGVYLFPSGVVDARGGALRIFSAAADTAAEAQGKRLVVSVEGQRFAFKADTPEQASEAAQLCSSSFREYDEARREQRPRDIARLDPLAESGFTNPFSPQSSLIPRRPGWVYAAGAFAVLASGALGWATWKGRNLASEKRLYAAATELDTVSAFRDYVDRGGTRRQVVEMLLPRAELKQAAGEQSVEAIEKFIEENSDSRVLPEAQAALHQALLNELEKASESGEIAPLIAFEQRYGKYESIAAHVRKAKHAVFAAAEKRFAESVADEDLAEFGERLFDYLEKHHTAEKGSVIELRFARKATQTPEMIDHAIRRSAYFMGNPSLPSQYFDLAHEEKRRELIADQLRQRWQAAFPERLVKVELGEPLNDLPDDELPYDVKVPTLYVLHTTALSGSYTNLAPRGIWVGQGVKFRAELVIPEDDEIYTFRFAQWLPPDLNFIRSERPSIEQVYERSASGAFKDFATKFLAHAFKQPLL